MSSLLDSYLMNIKESKADKTYRSYRGVIEHHIKPRIGSLAPAKVSPRHITAMLEDMRKSPIAIAGTPKHGRQKRLVGARTCELAYIVVGAALKTVVPGLLVTVPKPKAQTAEMHPWTSDEAARFLKYVDQTLCEHRALYRVALRTGARKGELLALRVADFDPERRIIQITKTFNEKLGQDGPPKTPSSRRAVALSKETVAALKKHILATGVRGDDRLFPVKDVRTLGKSMQRTMRAAEVPMIRFHDLRHTFATLALAARVPIKVVSEMLGHKSVKLTLDVYAHTLPGMHESAVEALEAVF
ncbi:MAG: site-specific integrase [bacterium]|nr:site-specific integrase [bacterium]